MEAVEILLKEGPSDTLIKAYTALEGTALHLAAESGNLKLVKLLLKYGADVNVREYFRLTPLHVAKTPEVAIALIEKGADVNAGRSRAEFTPLHVTETPEIAIALIKKGADVNAETKHGTPLHVAASPGIASIAGYKHSLSRMFLSSEKDAATFHPVAGKRSLEMAKLLLKDKRIEVNKTDKQGRTALYIATLFSNKRVLKLLLKDKRVDINKADRNGFTIFHLATLTKNIEIIELLLKDKRVNPNLASKRNGKTALHLAAEGGELMIVELLLKDKRTEVNKTDKDGNTPLDLTTDNRVKKLLQRHGGKRLDPFKKTNAVRKTRSTETPQEAFFRYVVKGDVKKVEDFLTHKSVDPNKADQHGWTALHWALLGENTNIVKLLLKDKRVNPNKASKGGLTPFHIASKLESTERLLLEDKRVDVNVTPQPMKSFIEHIQKMYHELRYKDPQKVELIRIDRLDSFHAKEVHQQMKERLDHPELTIYPMNLGTRKNPRYMLLEGSHRVTSASVMGRPVVLKKWNGQRDFIGSTHVIKEQSFGLAVNSLDKIIKVTAIKKIPDTEQTKLLEKVILRTGLIEGIGI